MNKKVKITIGVIIVIGALAYLITRGLTLTAVPYMDVSKFKNTDEKKKEVKLSGKVKKGSIEKSDDSLTVNFVMQSEGETLPVKYEGVTPDVFKEGLDVVVRGKLSSAGVFHAEKLITKCPSKYESKDNFSTQKSG